MRELREAPNSRVNLPRGYDPEAFYGGVTEERHVKELGQQYIDAYEWALEEIPEAGIPRVENRHAARMAMLIHNQMENGTMPREAYRFGVDSALEDIQTTDLALPTKWSLPIIRRIYPAIFDSPFFATQTMPGPLAFAFFMDYTREVDSSDFRFLAPFLVQIKTSTIATATTFTVAQSSKANAIVLGQYQLTAGQVLTVGLGTGNQETATILSVNKTTGVVTLTAGLANSHNAGDWVQVNIPSSLAEAAVPTKAKVSLTRSTVTAKKYMYAATWTTEAMEDARAQLNLDLEAEMIQALSIEVGRELFGKILDDILVGATAGSTNIPAIGATTVTDYKTLAIQPLYDAEAKIYAKRFHDASTVLCGIDLATLIQQQATFHPAPADKSFMTQLGVTHLGTFQGKWEIYKTAFLPPNTGLLFDQPSDWLHAGYVYMPYVPLAPMPLVYAGFNSGSGNYTNTDEWTRNIRTRSGSLLTVSDEYGLIFAQ